MIRRQATVGVCVCDFHHKYMFTCVMASVVFIIKMLVFCESNDKRK